MPDNEEQPEAGLAEAGPGEGAQAEEALSDGGIMSQAELDALMAAADAEAAEAGGDGWTEEQAGGEAPPPLGGAGVDLPSFDAPARFAGAVAASEAGGLGRVRDIPLEVTVELGRTRLLIRDILDLGAGSIIELDKIAGEPVELYANGLLMARGEVVVIDDNFGVRVTEIITAAERQAGKDAHALAA